MKRQKAKVRSEKSEYPEFPGELWGLWDTELKLWILATDSAGEPILCYTSEREALLGLDYHREEYEFDNLLAIKICQPTEH